MENQEYDLLLRSMFDSCDTTGNGLLSSKEFETLCVQLSLEGELHNLRKYLFDGCTVLTYAKFREGLLLLLSGVLPSDKTEQKNKHQTMLSDSSELSTSDGYRDNDDVPISDDLDDNRTAIEQASKYCYNRSNPTEKNNSVKEESWLVIDIKNEEINNDNQVSSPAIGTEDFVRNTSQTARRKVQSPGRKNRKYGRRTLPDLDLVRGETKISSESAMDSHMNRLLLDQEISERTYENDSKSNNVRNKFNFAPLEEITGEGDGSNWQNPENMIEDEPPPTPTEDAFSSSHPLTPQPPQSYSGINISAQDAQEALSTIWTQVIGSLDSTIDVNQLQKLFHAQALTTSFDDVTQLFAILDTDGDGLICFNDFASLMSMVLPSEEEAGQNNMFKEITNPQVNERVHTPVCQLFPNEFPYAHSTPHELVNQPAAAQQDAGVTSMDSTSGFMSNQTSNDSRNTTLSSAESSFTSTPQKSNLEDDLPDLHCIGAPTYRRRRRSNHATSRSSRRRSAKMTSLPHYHPISRRRLEDSALYFLAGENGRYVEIEKLKSIWSEEGIPDPDHVLEELHVNLDDSLSVEVLSEAMDQELSDNMVHLAACALYKNGIKYYKSQKDHEASERMKIESTVDHLNTQLHEQEERIDSMEINFQGRLNDVEKEYKIQLVELRDELATLHSKNKKSNEAEELKLLLKLDRLHEIEEELKNDLDILENENKRLILRNSTLSKELKIAETNVEHLKSDFEKSYHYMKQCNQAQTDQQRHLERLLKEYETSSKNVRDGGDELFGHLDSVMRTWFPHDQATSSLPTLPLPIANPPQDGASGTFLSPIQRQTKSTKLKTPLYTPMTKRSLSIIDPDASLSEVSNFELFNLTESSGFQSLHNELAATSSNQ